MGPPLAGVLADSTHDYKWPVFIGAIAAVLAVAAVTPLRLTAESNEVELEAAVAE